VAEGSNRLVVGSRPAPSRCASWVRNGDRVEVQQHARLNPEGLRQRDDRGERRREVAGLHRADRLRADADAVSHGLLGQVDPRPEVCGKYDDGDKRISGVSPEGSKVIISQTDVVAMETNGTCRK